MVKEKSNIIFTTGKRRKAVARAKVYPGNGRILLNSTPIEIWGNEVLRLWISEPLALSGDVSKSLNFDVKMRGGGLIGQAEAARMAIARGIEKATRDKKLREKFMKYDRNLLVYDPRRNEPHHAGGASRRGSRRHKQRSKR
jgi:small subunit ribosomal protein S9